MQPRRSGWLWVLLASLILLVGVGVIWVNLKLTETLPGGEEFIVPWYAIRSWMHQGNSPYNLAVQLEIEMLAYGHAVRDGEPRLSFTMPLYAAILYFPFALFEDFALARAAWMMALELALLGSMLLGVRLAGWKPSLPTWLLLVIFTWGGYFSLVALQSGSPVGLSMLLLLTGFTLLRSDRLEMAGMVFALVTCFPQAPVLAILFVLFWALASRKQLMVVWFIAGIAILTVLGMFFIQDWPLQYLRMLVAYFREDTLLTPSALMSSWWPGIGRQLAWALTALVGLILAVEWLQVRGKDHRWFLWVSSLTLALEIWVGLPTSFSSLAILLPALILVLANWEQRLGKAGRWLAAASLLLLLAGYWISAGRNQPSTLNGSVLFSLPFFLLLGLYWVRWWAIRPARTLLEELRIAGYY